MLPNDSKTTWRNSINAGQRQSPVGKREREKSLSHNEGLHANFGVIPRP